MENKTATRERAFGDSIKGLVINAIYLVYGFVAGCSMIITPSVVMHWGWLTRWMLNLDIFYYAPLIFDKAFSFFLVISPVIFLSAVVVILIKAKRGGPEAERNLFIIFGGVIGAMTAGVYLYQVMFTNYLQDRVILYLI